MADEEDLFAELLPSKEGQIALATLQYHVLGNDVDESELGPETQKLRSRYRAKNTKNFSVTLSSKFKGTSEDLAASMNRQETWLDDPVNNLVSRINGTLFMKKDTVHCTENATEVSSIPPYFHPIEMTPAEKREVRELKEDIQLFERAVEMIKDLDAKVKMYEDER